MKFLSFLFALITAINLLAQKPLRTPLSAVPSDSIGLWDMGTTNWKVTANHFNKRLSAEPFVADKTRYKSLKKQFASPSFTLTGGQLPLLNIEEGYQASKTLKDAVQLFLLTGESHTMDIAETILFNTLPYALHRPDISSFDKGVIAQSLHNGIGAIYATAERHVYANFYLNSFVRLQLDTLHVTFDQITNMPYLPGSKFRIGGLSNGTHRIALHLRLPAWAEPNETKLSVNGHEETLNIQQGYIVIDRAWNNDDEAFVQFSYKPRLLTTPLHQNIIALGPLLFVPRPSKKLPTGAFPQIEELDFLEDEQNTICLKAGEWEFIPLQECTEKAMF